jgi:hypothetical protein
MNNDDLNLEQPIDTSIDADSAQRDQLLWELSVLKSRVAELEKSLVRVTAQRDAAIAALGATASLAAEPVAQEDDGIESWQPTNSCRYCDGEGVIWVHDFRMDCKRCSGTGISTSEA